MDSDEVLRRYRSGERAFGQLDIDDPIDATPLRSCVLDGADFTGSFLLVDFAGASLRAATFRDANVKTCCFDAADLTGTDFRGAVMEGATFRDATLTGACFEGASIFGQFFGAGEVPESS